ncbi:MAG: rhodanese-like domain-containing protein [Desulfuromonas sp.]|uniref:rhodanese-like domain-containing protein n=1 Tax=Desulfuromonas sp. TaxID=892 RepID=UPI000CAF14EF|nr:rhodanese-like domain-containing protein [Desulfuromonas sp.]PLX82197.1 MAG: rhodanese-like domain-containing protein [Desulfuromonas sp.]
MSETRTARRVLLEAAVIFLLGVVMGLSFHHRLVLEAFSGRAAPVAGNPVTPSEEVFPQPVDLESVRVLAEAGAVLVDARASELFAAGRPAGAVSLPFGEVEDLLGRFSAEVPAATVLITYCSGYGCPDSFDLALRLIAAGYRDVRVFEGGFPEWRDAGLPLEEGTP